MRKFTSNRIFHHTLNFVVGNIVEVFNFTVVMHRQIESSMKNSTYMVLVSYKYAFQQ